MTDQPVEEKPVNQLSTHLAPAFMAEDGVAGTEELRKYVLPPRLLVMQAQQKPPLDRFNPGAMVLMPDERIIVDFDRAEQASVKPIIFVPIFHFVEFTVDNPIEIHASHGKIRQRTFDPTSDIAKRAQSRDKSVRQFVCPEMKDKMCKYVVRLNYLWFLLTSEGEEPVNAPCMITFKSTGMNDARSLNTLITARKKPIYGCQFAAEVGSRSNDKGKWYGVNITNPPVGVSPWVEDPELYGSLKQAHEDARDAHAQQLFEFTEDHYDEGSSIDPNADF